MKRAFRAILAGLATGLAEAACTDRPLEDEEEQPLTEVSGVVCVAGRPIASKLASVLKTSASSSTAVAASIVAGSSSSSSAAQSGVMS